MSIIISKVEWTNVTGTTVYEIFTDIPEPSSYTWSKQDISSEGAGRSISSDMVKLLKGKARKLELKWTNRDSATVATILQIFDTEYAWITYIDALTGTSQRKHFYMGDMTAEMYNYDATGGVWSSVGLNCIQGKTDKV